MQSKKSIKVFHSVPTTIGGFHHAKTNYNSPVIKKQLEVVRKEVKTIQDGANIDPQKMSLNFSV